ncbi:hypothetical protein DFS33DRAFT_811925 [Desarmillaria ectypa]|nr:hypothetical protein DFS33DRAFT_811925 [Desarmillaria ectypa]
MILPTITEIIPDILGGIIYSLNSAFFHTSMAAQYRTFKLERYTNLKVIEHLRDPEISKFVRRLDFDYSWFTEADSRIVAGFSAMSRMLVYLNDIQEISILWDTVKVPMEFFASLWNAFGTNLKKLTIDASLSNSIHMLASHLTFPSLEDMERVIRGRNITIEDGALDEGCLHQCFSSTIRRLTIHGYHVDPSNIFSLLPCFTDLGVLHVTTDALSDPTGLGNILTQYAHTLKDVALEEIASSSQSIPLMKPLFDKHVNEHTRTLSNLQSLSLIHPHLPFNVLESCLHRSSDTLTSLILPNNRLTYNQLEKVVTIFSRAQLLRTLHVSESPQRHLIYWRPSFRGLLG